jgi:exopolyphosphatase/guanosine-5'-triphosphate,3'-diphosphate pyrophosphatase
MTGAVDGPVAALDCGTNSTRLLVADTDRQPLSRLMRITRLGERVDAARKLDPAAIDRTIDVLAEYRMVMDRLGVVRGRLVATSAVRDASNGDEFMAAARDTTGIEPELLAGDEEGRLAHAGATADLPHCEGDTVVVDIGGGSTELVLEHEGQVRAVSLDLGCVRLSERLLHHDPPTQAELMHARATVDEELDRAVRELPVLGSLAPRSRLLGLAGTVTTISALEQRIDHYRRELIHHSVLTADTVNRWCATLASEGARQRARRQGMTPGREDVIVGGALVLVAVMERFGFAECMVSESDILDGMVDSLLTPA